MIQQWFFSKKNCYIRRLFILFKRELWAIFLRGRLKTAVKAPGGSYLLRRRLARCTDFLLFRRHFYLCPTQRTKYSKTEEHSNYVSTSYTNHPSFFDIFATGSVLNFKINRKFVDPKPQTDELFYLKFRKLFSLNTIIFIAKVCNLI